MRTKSAAVRLFQVMCVLIGVASASAWGAEAAYVLQIKGHRFEPNELRLPAHTRVKLTIHNLDATAEEFESYALNREKLVPAGGAAVVYVGPLKPGRYAFWGEFHRNSAFGEVVVESAP